MPEGNPEHFRRGWKGERCLTFVQAESQIPFPSDMFVLCYGAAVLSIGLYSRPALAFSLHCFLWLRSADEGDFWQTTQQFWGLRFIFVTDQHIPLKWVRRFQKNWVSYTLESVPFLLPHTQYHPVRGMYTVSANRRKSFKRQEHQSTRATLTPSFIKSIVHPKNTNSIFIYSPFNCFQALWVHFFCWTLKEDNLKNVGNLYPLTSMVVVFITVEVND